MGKEITPSPSSDPTASRGFCLDDVWGPVHTTQVTIPLFGTVSKHGNTGVWAKCMWVQLYLLNQYEAPSCPPLWYPTATYGELHSGSSQIPICLWNMSALPHRSPCQGNCWQGHSNQPGTTGGPPNRNLRIVCLLPPERMDSGGVEPPGPGGVARSRTKTGQGATAQMGTPVCLQQPGPGQNILGQAPD